MLVEVPHESWLQLQILPEEVSVELSILPAKSVWLILEVVGAEMAEDLWSHMSMICSRSHGWEEHRSHVLVALSCD